MASKTSTSTMWDMDYTKMMTDMQKAWTDMKIPGADMEAFTAAQSRNVEAITAANKLAIEGMQAVAKRQGELMRLAMEEMATAMQSMTAAGAPEDKIAQQVELTKKALEQTAANMKELGDMVSRSNTEAAEVISARVSEMLDEIKVLTAKK